MQLFHILVLVISISVFIGLFIYTAIVFYKKDTLYPQNISTCPDYWTVNSDGTCQIPPPGSTNLGNLGSAGKQLYLYPNITAAPRFNGATSAPIPNISFLGSYADLSSRVNPSPIITGKPINNAFDSNTIPYGYDVKNPTSIDFGHPGWASYGDPYCAIQSWAKIQNIQWDGMASYNKC